MPLHDLTGQRFGRWTVVSRHDAIKYTSPAGYGATIVRWLCRCDCGTEKVVRGQSLKSGKSVSCRCYQREFQREKQTKHGLSDSPEYAAWAHMMDRCCNPRNPEYKNYGARGIDVCKRWKTAANFLADMGARPSARHSLERNENSVGYSPDNCRWATAPEQCNNTRVNRRLRFNGKVQTVTQWAKQTGISANNIWNRLNDGWSTADALSIPISKDRAGWEARRTRKRVTKKELTANV